MTGELRESGGQEIEKVERFLFRRLQDELPEDMGLSLHAAPDKGYERFAPDEEVVAGEDQRLSILPALSSVEGRESRVVHSNPVREEIGKPRADKTLRGGVEPPFLE